MMAVQSVCLCGVLLLVTTLWTIGATQKISVGFSDTELEAAEDKQVLRAIINVEVPEGLDFSGFGEDLTVHVTSENGEAIAGEDFEAVDKTITMTKEDLHDIQTDPDRGNRIVRIPLTEDDYTEGAETFTLTLEAHPDVDVKADSATITITDSNKPVNISFDQPTYTAYTSEGTPLKVKVLKTGHIQENTGIAVNVIFSNGPSTQTIHFKPSQDAFDISFHEHVSNDATYSLRLALADPSQNLEGLVVFGAAAEVKVTDFTPEDSHILMVLKGLLEKRLNENIEHLQAKYDDLELKYNHLQETIVLAVWFDQNDYPVWESDRTVRVCLRKNLETSEVISVTVTAKESSPASATGGKDFSTDPRKITIPAGSEGTACTDIDITDDSVALEGNETFTLTLTVDDHSPPVTSAATVTIIDDDGVEVNLTDKVFVAQRNRYHDYALDVSYDYYRVDVCLRINTTIDGYLKVPLVLSRADTETGPAIQNASVKLYAGRLLNCKQIKIIPSEWPLKLEIGSVLPDHMVAGSPSTATVDGLAVWFEQSHYTVQEDNKVRVCLKKNLKTSQDLFVTVTAKDLFHAATCASCATGGEDFSTDPQTITIPAGSEDASHCKDLDIIIDDTATERTETFTLTLTVEDHPGVTSSVRVTIRDDDDYNDYSTDYRDHYVAYDDSDKRTYVWVIVAVVAIIVIILAVAVAACVIYHQRTKIKDCFASPYQKLPTDIHIETITF